MATLCKTIQKVFSPRVYIEDEIWYLEYYPIAGWLGDFSGTPKTFSELETIRESNKALIIYYQNYAQSP